MIQEAQIKLELHYLQSIDIWEKFCLLHKELFEITAKEYLILLEGDLDRLEIITKQKENLISQVSLLDKDRTDLINEINHTLSHNEKITKAIELIKYFSDYESKKNLNALKNLNDLLVNIIENLQEQNKKNQLFLNKAMISVKELQDSFRGKKVFTTYGSDGLTKSVHK
jgi:flagellar biosynthesis/type III secretory pathway chaperone